MRAFPSLAPQPTAGPAWQVHDATGQPLQVVFGLPTGIPSSFKVGSGTDG